MRTNGSISLESIYSKYGRLIYSIAFQKTNNHDSASDVLQQCFVKIIKHEKKIATLEEPHLMAFCKRLKLY